MADSPRESEGPDPSRGSLRCLEFHDPRFSGLGGNYNCCCCQPCLYVRPFMAVASQDEHEWNACCNCAPRLIYARFIPDYPGDECCVTAAMPMAHRTAPKGPGARAPADYRSLYSGSLFSIDILVELGRVGDYYSECGWRVTMTRSGHYPLPDVNYRETFPIDHAYTTCLSVPAVEVPCVGPDGCEGRIVLEDVETAKLPFVEREEVRAFADVRPPDAHSECAPEYDSQGELIDKPECDPEFIDLYPPCGWDAVLVDGQRWREIETGYETVWRDDYSGMEVYWSDDLGRWVIGLEGEEPVAYGPASWNAGQPYGTYCDDPDDEGCAYGTPTVVAEDPYGGCSQVCSRLKERRVGRPFPWNCLEWRWFEETVVDEYTGQYQLVRGWRKMDPRGGGAETLWLEEDEEGRCMVRPDFSQGGVPFASALIPAGGCSCAMNVVVVAAGASSARFRCGFCQRWTHFCGTCRCVPSQLCVTFFDGETFTPDIVLDWDAAERQWGGYGDPLQLALASNPARGCEIRAVLPFDWTPPTQWPLHDCGEEFTADLKRFRPQTHVLDAAIEGSRQLDSGLAPVIISAHSLDPHCGGGPCQYLPCDEACGSNPRTVTATVEIYYYELGYEEESGGGQGMAYVYADGWCSFSLTLSFSRRITSITGEGMETGCGYEGFYKPAGENCATLRVAYSAGKVNLTWIRPDIGSYGIEVDVAEEACDPFYATTNEHEDPLNITSDGYWAGEWWPTLPDLDQYTEACYGCVYNWFGIVFRVVITA